MRIVLVLAAAAIAGCAASGITPMGQDTYMAAKQGAVGFSSFGTLKAELFTDANTFCAKQGKQLQPVAERGVEGRIGQFPTAEVTFRCLAASDPEAGRPEFKMMK
jgi:hypothetical protein